MRAQKTCVLKTVESRWKMEAAVRSKAAIPMAYPER